jgi:hypothetical protein
VLGGSKPILRPILVSDVRKTLQISDETAPKIKSWEMGISSFIPCICKHLGGPQDQRGHLAAPLCLSRAQLASFPTSGHWREAKKRHVRASSGNPAIKASVPEFLNPQLAARAANWLLGPPIFGLQWPQSHLRRGGIPFSSPQAANRFINGHGRYSTGIVT